MVSNNQNNNQVNSPFSIEPMDIPASINTSLNSVVDRALNNLFGESKGIDTRLETNLVKGKFGAIDLLLTFVSYEQKLKEGKSKTDAAGEALMETLFGMGGAVIGARIGGFVGSIAGPHGFVIGSVIGTVTGGIFLSKPGSIGWQKFNEFLEALAKWSVKPNTNTLNTLNLYPEKVRNSLREGTRRIDPLVIDLDGDGIELTDINESNAMFDLTGSGFANRVGWVYNFA